MRGKKASDRRESVDTRLMILARLSEERMSIPVSTDRFLIVG